MKRFLISIIAVVSMIFVSPPVLAVDAGEAVAIGVGATIAGAYCKKHPIKCAVAGVVAGGLFVHSQLDNEEAPRKEEESSCRKRIWILSSLAPEATKHILDAQAMGHPVVLTYDSNQSKARARRRLSTAGWPTNSINDNDEYPPATFVEGGKGASIRPIPRGDNRSAGSQIGRQVTGLPDGCKVAIGVR